MHSVLLLRRPYEERVNGYKYEVLRTTYVQCFGPLRRRRQVQRCRTACRQGAGVPPTPQKWFLAALALQVEGKSSRGFNGKRQNNFPYSYSERREGDGKRDGVPSIITAYSDRVQSTRDSVKKGIGRKERHSRPEHCFEGRQIRRTGQETDNRDRAPKTLDPRERTGTSPAGSILFYFRCEKR